MKNTWIEEKLEQWAVHDSMCDARQADYDYDGEVPENEDIADWHKYGKIGGRKL